MKEIIFLVNEAEEGGYYAEAAGANIFAEGDTIEDLKQNIEGGIDCHFEDKREAPAFTCLQPNTNAKA